MQPGMGSAPQAEVFCWGHLPNLLEETAVPALAARCALCRPCPCWQAAGAILNSLGALGSRVLRIIEHPKVEGTRNGH